MADADENFEIYGTLLEPYDEDNVPKKKAFTIEDQIATDAQGRRRFHGAFTGGFSAGFFNSVGSLEGWKPSEFKSSRSEKGERKLQKPEDFMDDEDVGEFGIAPKVLRATSDYDNTNKRKRNLNTTNTIPGVPALQALLPAKDTVGIKLLKQMGWKPGQGIGPRLTKSEKVYANREHKKHTGKVYGCEVPAEFQRHIDSEEEASSEDELDITFAPDDYDLFIYKPKDNTFGMGYTGLNKNPILSSHISLFPCPQFKMQDSNNKKISISGQAFGVGAFEDEDEDIYVRDDMSKYDFELEAISSKKKNVPKKESKSSEVVLEGFTTANNPVAVKKNFPPPVLPKNFIPKHGVRISRFEPLPETHQFYNNDRLQRTGRHDLTAADRSQIINSENVVIKQSIAANKTLGATLNTPDETEIIKEKAEKITRVLASTSEYSFKPFIAYPDKQKRYEEYLKAVEMGERDKLADLQPASMSDWEKENEKREFEQAIRIFKPIQGMIFDKFVQSSTLEDFTDLAKQVQQSTHVYTDEEKREAAKNKKFGHLTRTIEIWKPNKLLCKRFNVPEPDDSNIGTTLTTKKKNKFSVFDYYEAYQQNTTVKEGPEPFEQNNQKLTTTTSTTVNNFADDLHLDSSSSNKEKIQSATADMDKEAANTSDNNASTSAVEEQELNENVNTDTDLQDLNKALEKTSDENVKTVPLHSNSDVIDTNSELSKTTNSTNLTINTNVSVNVSSNNQSMNLRSSKISLPEPKISIPTDPKEKIDLFKAIFLSSSDSESETEETEPADTQVQKISEMKKIVLEEVAAKPIQEKIKPSKGIFSDLNLSEINKQKPETSTSVTERKEEREDKQDDKDNNVYGPKLPTKNINELNWKPTYHKVSLSKEDDFKKRDSSDEDEWLEIETAKKNTQKCPKKRKKHKNDRKHEKFHKKKKSKHKKKKHSDRH